MFNLLLNTVTSPTQAAQEPAEKILNHAQAAVQTPSFLRLGLAFVGLILALWVIVWILRKISGSKFGLFSSDTKLKIIERKNLSPKTVLYVVEVEGQKLLVSESAHHVKIKELQTTSFED